MTTFHQPPYQADGLYDPRYEHDACGVALVARLDNQATREVVDKALMALENLEHRGATGADSKSGDGAGILTQMPDTFCARRSTSTFLRSAPTASRCAFCRRTRRCARRSRRCSS